MLVVATEAGDWQALMVAPDALELCTDIKSKNDGLAVENVWDALFVAMDTNNNGVRN